MHQRAQTTMVKYHERGLKSSLKEQNEDSMVVKRVERLNGVGMRLRKRLRVKDKMEGIYASEEEEQVAN